MQVHYLFDPLCGWCYGAAPLVRAITAQLPPEIPLRLWPGLSLSRITRIVRHATAL